MLLGLKTIITDMIFKDLHGDSSLSYPTTKPRQLTSRAQVPEQSVYYAISGFQNSEFKFLSKHKL